MARRPFIEEKAIRDNLFAIATHQNNGGYRTHCKNYEPVGMDGRCDWFRWECRDCDKTYISPRGEKRMRYYKCRECDALHFVYKGFFALPDRKNGSETVPLRQDEFEGTLCRVKLVYDSLSDREDGEWYYGSPEWCREKVEKDNYSTVEPIQKV